ncbi:MAG: acylphosphatase [Bacteroidota bacterium]
MNSSVKVEILVTGRVQGVGYRFWIRNQAIQLNLTGFVRNNPDQSVSIVAEGNPEALNVLIAQCRQGPPRCSVSDIEYSFQEPVGYKEFNIR